MNAQLDLDWTRKHVRTGDPSTSIRAAESMQGSASSQCAAILSILATSDEPMAAEQIADRLGMITHEIGKRLPDLGASGLITKTGEIHRNRSGRLAFKWVAQ